MGQTFSILYTVHSMLQDCTSGFFCCSNRIRKIITKMSASHIFQEMVVILSLEKKSKGNLQICSKNVLKSCILYERKCNLSVVDVRWKLERSEKLYF